MNKISIITINYNNLEGLKLTINSVLPQTWKDFEWIIVDGGSTDGSRELIESVSTHLSYWCSEHDWGIFHAMNKGIHHAKGEYLLFLNSGDYFSSSKSLQHANPQTWSADIVGCDAFMGSGKKKTYYQSPRKVTYQRLVCMSLCHQSTFIRRMLLTEKNYDETSKIGADWMWWFYAFIENDFTYTNIPVPITVFDTTGISITATEARKKERLDFLLKYFSPSMLKKVKEQCNWDDELEYQAILNSEKSALLFMRKVVNKLYSFIITPFYLRYKLLRFTIYR